MRKLRQDTHPSKETSTVKAIYSILLVVFLVMSVVIASTYGGTIIGKAYEVALESKDVFRFFTVGEAPTIAEEINVAVNPTDVRRLTLTIDGRVLKATASIRGDARGIRLGMGNSILFAEEGELTAEPVMLQDFSSQINQQCSTYPCEIELYVISNSYGLLTLGDIEIVTEDQPVIISIATLKDEYAIGEPIELTDPPGVASPSPDEDEYITTFDASLAINPLGQSTVILSSGPNALSSFVQQTAQKPNYVSNQLVIKLKSGSSQFSSSALTTNPSATGITGIDALNIEYSVSSIKPVFASNIQISSSFEKTYRLSFAKNVDIEQLASLYASDPSVDYAEPNYLYYVSYTPSDPNFVSQWAHRITEAEKAWDITLGSEDIIIAVIDSGVDWQHEDLTNNIWRNSDESNNGLDTDANGFTDDIRGYDFVDISVTDYQLMGFEPIQGEDYTVLDNDPMDFNGHGTHVAGIVAASHNNVGVAGVCANCRIMPIRAGFSLKYFGNEYGLLSTDAIVAGIIYAADNGASIISMSFGGPQSQATQDALEYAQGKGVVLIAAAGNSNTYRNNFAYPAAYDNVIAVASTDRGDDRSYFSNYGPWVKIAAPGSDILSTVPTRIASTGYASFYGTSMAAPFVSGVAGIVLSNRPELNADEVREVLRQSVDQFFSEDYAGSGRINVFTAVNKESIIVPTATSQLDSPTYFSTLSSDFDITGTASGDHYVLDYGQGPYPNTWNIIAEGDGSAAGLLSTFDIDIVEDGYYTIRLTATGEGSSSALTSVFIHKNTLPGFPYKTMGAVPASPLVSDLDNDGSPEIIFESVEFFDNPYTSTLHVLNSDGSVKAGWPKIFIRSSAPATPSLGDLDRDGFIEVVYYENNNRKLHVFDYKGEEKPGWPQDIEDNLVSNGIQQSPILSDMDADGYLDVLDARIFNDYFYIFDRDGALTNKINLDVLLNPSADCHRHPEIQKSLESCQKIVFDYLT